MSILEEKILDKKVFRWCQLLLNTSPKVTTIL